MGLSFTPPDYYAASYPGPRPANLSETCACAADRIWATAGVRRGQRDPDSERLRRLEATIDEASSASSLQEPIEDWHERLEAFVRGKQSVPALVELLSHEHERVRWAAAAALEQMGARAEPAISALVDALVRDGSRKAGDALAAIGTPAIAPLIATLANGDRAVRWEAVLALTEIGETAVRDLQQAANDDDERVRVSALEALDWIKDKPLFTSHTQPSGQAGRKVAGEMRYVYHRVLSQGWSLGLSVAAENLLGRPPAR